MELDRKILLADLASPAVLFPEKWRPASRKFLTWLAANKVPSEFIDLYRDHSPATYAQLGSGGLNSPAEILEEHSKHPTLLNLGLLCIGRTSNGDLIAMDIRDHVGTIGYISHESLWDTPTPEHVRTIFRWVSPTLGMFVRGLLRNAVPMDYCWTWSTWEEIDHGNE